MTRIFYDIPSQSVVKEDSFGMRYVYPGVTPAMAAVLMKDLAEIERITQEDVATRMLKSKSEEHSMKADAVRFEIAKLELKPTDILVMKCRADLIPDAREQIVRHAQEMLKAAGYDNRVIVLTDDFNLGVISKAPDVRPLAQESIPPLNVSKAQEYFGKMHGWTPEETMAQLLTPVEDCGGGFWTYPGATDMVAKEDELRRFAIESMLIPKEHFAGCTCGHPQAANIVHSAEKPCYVKPEPTTCDGLWATRPLQVGDKVEVLEEGPNLRRRGEVTFTGNPGKKHPPLVTVVFDRGDAKHEESKIFGTEQLRRVE